MSSESHPLHFSVAALRENQGLSTSVQISPSLILNSADDKGKLADPVEVDLDFSIGGDLILLQARVSGAWIIECSRCLEIHEAAFDTETEAAFPIGRDTIDVTAELHDAVVIEFPQRSLCRTDCKGLCSSCGNNLNKGACSCTLSGKNDAAALNKKSSFEALRKLKK